MLIWGGGGRGSRGRAVENSRGRRRDALARARGDSDTVFATSGAGVLKKKKARVLKIRTQGPQGWSPAGWWWNHTCGAFSVVSISHG